MYQDYLQERQKYKQPIKRKKRPKRRGVRPVVMPNRQQNRTGAQEYLRQSQKYNNQVKKQLDAFELTGFVIGKSLRILVDTLKTEHSLILLGVAALFGLVNYLNNANNSSYSDQFAGGYGNSGMSSGKMSEQGVHDLLQYEGFDPVAVDREGDGILTIGYGHKGKDVKPGQTITREQAKELFKKDLKSREDTVNRLVKVPITQNMFDALVSFVYNAGAGSFENSDILRKLNAKDYKGAAEAWKTQNIRQGSKFESGLRARRAKEAAKFATDINADNTLKKVAINDEVIKSTSAGKIRRMANGTMIDNYKLYNPVAHDGKYYIDLSERAEAYLKESGGKGLVTSGAEGKHGNNSEISHGKGNKLDIQALKNTNEEWANTAIPFIKNNHTAYINFEDFSNERFNAIKQIIYKKISPELRTRCEGKTKYSFDEYKRFMFNSYTGGGLHLDIGIKPDAFSESESLHQNKENKPKPISPNIPTKKENNKHENPKSNTNIHINPCKSKTNNTKVVNTGIINTTRKNNKKK